MEITILPKQVSGKWSVGLFALAAVCFLLLVLAGAFFELRGVGLGVPGTLLSITFGIAALAALLSGVISLVNGERAALVFLVLFMSIVILVFFTGEFIFTE